MGVFIYLLGCILVLSFIKMYNGKMKKDGIESEIIPLEQSILAALFSWFSFFVLVFIFAIDTKTFYKMKNWFEG